MSLNIQCFGYNFFVSNPNRVIEIGLIPNKELYIQKSKENIVFSRFRTNFVK